MGKSSMTTVYMSFLATWARRLSWTETARVFASTRDNVRRAVEWVVELTRQRSSYVSRGAQRVSPAST